MAVVRSICFSEVNVLIANYHFVNSAPLLDLCESDYK
jgi:hypothetical protein